MTDNPGTTRRRPGPPAQTLDPSEIERLASIRADAVTAHEQLATGGPPDPLGALAWLATILDPTSTPTLLGQAMDRARAEGYTWRQIAQALDEGDTPEDGRRIMDRRKSWAAT